MNIFDAPDLYMKPWRLTLDETNDLELLNLIYKTLDVGQRSVSFSELIHYFERFPDAVKINSENIVKYRDNKGLVEYLKRETTI